MRSSGFRRDTEKAREFVERGRRSSAESLKPKKPMKRSQPRRDWKDARAKCEKQGCRLCEYWPAEAAHIVGREHDLKPNEDSWAFEALGKVWVDPARIVPLCKGHHRQYDPHTRGVNEEPLDLLPYLTADEKRQAFEDCDYDAFAYLQRLTGQRYVPVKEAT